MIIGPNYIENMLKHLEKEVKLYVQQELNHQSIQLVKKKIVMDFGMDYNDLKN